MHRLASTTTLLGLSLSLSLSCAKPSVETGSSGSGGGPHGERLTPTPGPASCPASHVREVRYGGTVAKQTKLPANIAARRCVDDLSQLDEDIACAQAYNQANWEQAMFDRGLAPLDVQADTLWFDDAQYGMDYGAVVEHPEEPGRRVVFVGMERYDCSGVNVHTPVGPGARLARGPDGEVVLILARPEVESRRYARCSCDMGCGMMREDMPLFVELPEGARFAGVVEIEYAAIAIVSHDVENQTCCCAP